MTDNTLVREGYDKVAKDYSAKRDQFKNLKYLVKLNSLLKASSKILDIGCGAGIPVDKYFKEKGYQLTGIDISPEQIKLAKQNVPNSTFLVKDISGLAENEFEVDAVVSFYSIFHIPREQHLPLLKKINSFLPAGGLMLITMGASEWEGTEDFHGTKMFWSHFGAEKNRELVKEAGFEIIFDEIDTSGGEKHLVVLGKKI